ncbi:hypothetical protein KC332_g16282 [Hortaea werneckii]|uniref:C2H2-type domain-containing protein n=1 Tax=Hortaea werneckii TaxID=91943 RepID=A0A3M7J784_HORWE|nr:hypothetical protein KC329_g16552 [Hortaea werneckii]KAI7255882.1 hypothetical protein KC335_g13600 [Hortaea werneckii]KAI7383426.1 hypothetical protein KC332_g16282 [Hortaea werneckii]KAI7391936.1 hypothetical protein KC336_g16629 [Hortaea werneckii]KAI7431570.1 hypothetical protein KC368_g16046 [Hortaea werneckii]
MSYNHQQYGGFYDPVGSQSNKQPTGYTYQTVGTTAPQYSGTATASYANAGYQSYGSQGHQSYGTTNNGASNTNQAATALSSLSSSYNQQGSAGRANSFQPHDRTSWSATGYPSYPPTDVQIPNRTQNTNSPAMTTSTYGQHEGGAGFHVPQTYPSARASATAAGQTYQGARNHAGQQAQTQPQPPQRYASPLHAMQAQQQGYSNQQSRNSKHKPSPQMAAQQTQQQRQQSASAEPSAVTVNPSQVYDDRAERERLVRIEEERRRKREAEEAARKAEEERLAAAERRKQEEARQVEEDRRKAEEDKRKAEEDRRKAEELEAKKSANQKRRAEKARQKRAEKKESNTAATALAQMASSNAGIDSEAPPANAEEAEMRAMFKKMREFNAKNPAMLAKMWEEERKAHASQSPQQTQPPPPPKSSAPPPTHSPATPAPTAQSQEHDHQQLRPFQRPMPSQQQAPPAALTITSPNQPVAAQANTSLWPPQKKGALAEAAGKWLLSLPENSGRRISTETIITILERNPSYVQLCEALEAHGFRFERSLLARELLKAVPDGLKGPTSQTTRPTQQEQDSIVQGSETKEGSTKKRGRPSKNQYEPKPHQQGPVAYETPSFKPLADTAREVNNMSNALDPQLRGGPVQPVSQPPSWANPHFANGTPNRPSNAGSVPPSQSQVPEQKPEIKPEAPRKPPSNKEEAARKTFGDLVDLTAQDSDEDDGPPKKMLQTSHGQMNGFNAQQTYPAPPPPGHTNFRPPSTPFNFYRPSEGPPPPVVYGFGPMASRAPPAQMVPPRPSSTQQPAPVPGPSKRKGPSLESQQNERIKGKMLVEPIMRDRVARKNKYDSRTIARDVLLATGRHPDMRSLNAHLYSMQKLLSTHGGGYESEAGRGDRSDLSTIKWEIIDPELPGEKAESKKPMPIPARGEDLAADADDEDDGAPALSPRGLVSFDNGDGTASRAAVPDPIGAKAPKRRGRPPKYNIAAGGLDGFRVGTPNRQAAGGGHPNSAPAARSAPTGSSTPGGSGATGYAAFRAMDESGNPVKKKGRPVGWRKAIHSREALGLAPATGANSHQSGPSRPRQKPAPVVEPKYQVFKCKWKDCHAELHNLETLKKHVIKLHGKPNANRKFGCLWDDCNVLPLADVTVWTQHFDRQHLQPIAWKQGDGPRGGISDHNATDSEAYLSDAQGRSVTPIITPNSERHQASASATPAALRRPGEPSQQPLTKDERKAAAELEELEQQKVAVGPSMDRTGVRMANSKRRKGFLDDEDFEDEVESEGEGPPNYGDDDDDDANDDNKDRDDDGADDEDQMQE